MNFAPILPELILTIGAIVLMMVAAFMGRRGNSLCSWASIALLIAAACGTAHAAEWRVDCPAQLSTTQSIAGPVAEGWAAISRTPSSAKNVKPGAADTDASPPVGVSVFDGPPVEMADLVPDDPNARIVRWTFAKNRTRDLYVVCYYGDTRIGLAHKAPPGLASCTLGENAPGVVCN